ncbi:MAG: hypothetical protein HY787_03020 [Deltaproteobacteria bacterium]|nr:hypothetical protein [Deltaproteobacteria bacterium]
MRAILKKEIVLENESPEKKIMELKEFLLSAPQKLDTERLKFLMESYRETEGEPASIRRARLFEKILFNKTLYIDENPIVGSATKFRAGVYPYPEWSCRWMKKDVESLSHLGKVNISDEDRKLINESVDYWTDRCVFTRTNRFFVEKYGFSAIPALKAGLFIDGVAAPQGGGTMDYPRVLNQGLGAIIKEVEQRMGELAVSHDNAQRINFYRAELIALRAVVKLAHRYADLAAEMSAGEADPGRKRELQEISEVCRWVPENPARTFREALQSFWLIHCCLFIEQSGCGYSPGRFGQYMDPFFKKDIKDGRMNREEAVNLLSFLFIKQQELGLYRGLLYFKQASAHTGQTITVGGLTPNGEDATSDLDYMLLDVQRQMKNIQPTISLFYHNNLKEDFLFKAVELIRTGVGQPQFMNNDITIQRLLDLFGPQGLTVQEARDCCNFGCVSTGVAGRVGGPIEGEISIAKAFELALNDGKDPLTGEQIGPSTGEAEKFGCYEELFEAFRKQLEFTMTLARRHGIIGDAITAEILPLPLRSSLIQGCIERGTDVWEGGAKYCSSMLISVGGVDAANSLAAIKKLVFEDRRISISRLKEALIANFEGHEEIMKMCLEAPKHGNDEDYMHEIIRNVYDAVDEAYHKVGPNFLGDRGKPEAYSLSMHNAFGEFCGALPSGRTARIALTDGSVSAMPGTDRNGPTALANSAARALDAVRFASNHCNMKFHPAALDGPAGARNLISLIKGYMDQGGSHIQFNCVSSKTLKEAQQNPQNHRNLVVRVAGFSAYFTRLDKGVQDEIIKRTELKF